MWFYVLSCWYRFVYSVLCGVFENMLYSMFLGWIKVEYMRILGYFGRFLRVIRSKKA